MAGWLKICRKTYRMANRATPVSEEHAAADPGGTQFSALTTSPRSVAYWVEQAKGFDVSKR